MTGRGPEGGLIGANTVATAVAGLVAAALHFAIDDRPVALAPERDAVPA